MQDLINELQQPRIITPAPASLRAAKVLAELHAQQQADLRGRLAAEERCNRLEQENIELRRKLNEAEATISKSSTGNSTNT